MRADRMRTLAGMLLAGGLVLPFLPLAVWSVAHGWRFPDLLPLNWSGKAWTYALSGSAGVLHSFALTSFIALATTALAAVIGVPAGRALGLYRFRGKGLVTLLILAPAILPYMTLVMAAVFARFDPAFEDQARSLGARPLQTFRYVTLPAILPGLLTGALFAFLVSWSQYLLTLAIGGGRVQTLPLVLYGFAASGRNDVTGAIALLYILPGVVILIVTARLITGRGAALAAGLRP